MGQAQIGPGLPTPDEAAAPTPTAPGTEPPRHVRETPPRHVRWMIAGAGLGFILGMGAMEALS